MILLSRMETKEGILARLHKFADLEADWDGYGAHTISSTAISKAIELIKLWPECLDYPYVFPSVYGGITMEWEDDAADSGVILEFDNQGKWDRGTGCVWDADNELDEELPIEEIKNDIKTVWRHFLNKPPSEETSIPTQLDDVLALGM